MVTSPKIKYFMAIPLVTTVKWLQLVTLEWYMKLPWGLNKKTSDVSRNSFGRFTQCRHHQSGNVPQKHLPKPTTGTHPRRLQKSPCSILWWFVGPQRTLNGPRRTKTPGAARPVFAKTSSKSHFCQVLLKPSHCLLLGKWPNPRWEFVASPTKTPFQRVTKGSCTWHGFRNRNLWFFKRSHFFSSFRSWTSKGCNLKVSGLGQLKA